MPHQFSMAIYSKLSCQKGTHSTDQAVVQALVNGFKDTTYCFLVYRNELWRQVVAPFVCFFFLVSLPVIQKPTFIQASLFVKGSSLEMSQAKTIMYPYII